MVAGASREPESEREMVISRTIDGPRELVFRAFTEPRHLARWYGPDGFILTTRTFTFEVGGLWEFTFHGPDGTDYPNWIRWQEITPPARLVFEHGSKPDDPEAFQSAVTFTEKAGKTEVTLRGLFKTKAQLDKVVREFNALEGGHQTLGRLASYVAELAAGGR
jgi:uncharacterized protein YndB with AHSA1/START domain